MGIHYFDYLATLLFALSILHTLNVSTFKKWALGFKVDSVIYNLLKTLAEIEIVFGFWSAILIGCTFFWSGKAPILQHINSLNFKEPLFVFVIMVTSATRPILELTKKIILTAAKILPLKMEESFYLTCLILGPLLGSLITEPAAMTVCALLLKDTYFKNTSTRFKFMTLALLFVNISLGGALTIFAAPPVIMVAHKWGWSNSFMFMTFGYKAFTSILISTFTYWYILKKEFRKLDFVKKNEDIFSFKKHMGLNTIHILFLFLIIYFADEPIFLIALFLFFIGFTDITKKYQTPLKIKESLLVFFFLAGLVVIGSFQGWWLTYVINNLSAKQTFFTATFLTAFTDNAALTYLGTLIPNLSDPLKYSLVAGALTGGGLTVIANAPNPAGYSILNENFDEGGIQAWPLFLYAILPTLISIFCFELLP